MQPAGYVDSIIDGRFFATGKPGKAGSRSDGRADPEPIAQDPSD